MTRVAPRPKLSAVSDHPISSTAPLVIDDASLEFHLLGIVGYEAWLALQEWTAFQISDRNDSRGTVFLCEHPPMITMGAEASSDDLLVDQHQLDREQLNIRWISRGGGTVVHWPGQLAVYAMLPLDRLGCGIVDFRRRIELAAIEACREIKVAAERYEDSPGIWTRGGQVGFFGAATKYRVSTHGLFINVEPDPAALKLAVGNSLGRKATSLASLRVRPATMHKFRQAMIHALVAQFEYSRFHVHTGHEQLRRTVEPTAVAVESAE